MNNDKNNKLFYGWYIIGITFIANFLTAGTTFYVMNAFMEPLCSTRGWSRTDVNLAPVFGTFVFIFSNLIYGTMILKIGPRIMMAIGAVVGGIAFALMGKAVLLWQFYFLFILLTLGNGAYGEIVANTAVNNWYVAKRGMAIGLSTTGKSLSGAFLPLLAMVLIMKYNIASAFFWIGLFVVAMGPITWLIVRNWPEDLGLAPDGIPATAPPHGTTPISEKPAGQGQQNEGNHVKGIGEEQEEIYTFSKLIRMGSFWKLGFVIALALISLVGTMSQLKPRFVDIGYSDMASMIMMSATALIGAAGKYIWGTLCDRFDSRHVVAVLMGTCAFGLSLSFIKNSVPALMLFIVIFGFGVGGILSTVFIITADFFGRKSFPAVFRYLTIFNLFQLAGFIISGQSFDRLGSYDAAYIFFIVSNISAGLLILTAKHPAEQGSP
jgi:sugar phosphate permease